MKHFFKPVVALKSLPFSTPKLGCTILVFLLMLTTIEAQDIVKKQVHFDKGTNGTTIEASIKGSQIIDYNLYVKKGQVMNVSMATNNSANYFNIMEPGEQYVAVFNGSMNENMFEGELKKTGAYTIRVYLMRSAARRNETANFRLEINVSPLQKQVMSHDAKVAGTDYHATGKVPCIIGKDGPKTNCDFGVKREGNGSGLVTITKPDGRTRTIFFQNGKAIGYDENEADKGEFSAYKNSGMYYISIGGERYQIPEEVIYGG